MSLKPGSERRPKRWRTPRWRARDITAILPDFTQLFRAQIGFSTGSRTPRSISFTFATAAATGGGRRSSTECEGYAVPGARPSRSRPRGEDGLRHALARVHRSYAGMLHARRKRGDFWQGRFGAVAMDAPRLAAAFRHVTLNPAPARLVRHAEDWSWSSARDYLGFGDDALTDLAPARQRFSRSPTRWKATKILPQPRGCAREKAWGAPSARIAFSPRRKPKPSAAYARLSADGSRLMIERDRRKIECTVMSGRRPLSRVSLRLCEHLGCGHVFGLFTRDWRPAGPDGSSA
jgi:hypothetical protein